MAEERANRYAELLADIDAEIVQLQADRAVIERRMGASGVVVTARLGDAQTVTPDAFFRMRLPAAMVKCLSIAKKPQTAGEIADALQRGGFTHSSKNFVNSVWTGLDRLDRRGGEIVKVGKQWGLAEWYPGRTRKKGKLGTEKAEEADQSEAEAKKAS